MTTVNEGISDSSPHDLVAEAIKADGTVSPSILKDYFLAQQQSINAVLGKVDIGNNLDHAEIQLLMDKSFDLERYLEMGDIGLALLCDAEMARIHFSQESFANLRLQRTDQSNTLEDVFADNEKLYAFYHRQLQEMLNNMAE